MMDDEIKLIPFIKLGIYISLINLFESVKGLGHDIS